MISIFVENTKVTGMWQYLINKLLMKFIKVINKIISILWFCVLNFTANYCKYLWKLWLVILKRNYTFMKASIQRAGCLSKIKKDDCWKGLK
jgi:hypothetical protein